MLGLWIGAAGLRAGQLRMDVIAHNIANLNTTAFRAGRTVFRDELSVRLSRPSVATPAGMPQKGTGVSLAAVLPALRPGSLEPTDDPRHLAITGAGYFQVEAGGEVLYTRDGAFTGDAEGHLVTADGAMLLGDDGDPVEVPEWAERIVVEGDGTVTAVASERSEAVAVIGLARFANPTGLAARGRNLFAETPASGPAEIERPGSGGTGTLVQGAVERANVNLAEEMTALLLTQRFAQLNARVVQTADEMMAMTNRAIS